jgi:uncharacterized radical SAM superfamily protein
MAQPVPVVVTVAVKVTCWPYFDGLTEEVKAVEVLYLLMVMLVVAMPLVSTAAVGAPVPPVQPAVKVESALPSA